MFLISAVFGPSLNNIPIGSKIRILASALRTRIVKPRHPDQFAQIMRMARFHFLLVWEFMPLSSLRDASLERTLNRITSKIVSAI